MWERMGYVWMVFAYSGLGACLCVLALFRPPVELMGLGLACQYLCCLIGLSFVSLGAKAGTRFFAVTGSVMLVLVSLYFVVTSKNSFVPAVGSIVWLASWTTALGTARTSQLDHGFRTVVGVAILALMTFSMVVTSELFGEMIGLNSELTRGCFILSVPVLLLLPAPWFMLVAWSKPSRRYEFDVDEV